MFQPGFLEIRPKTAELKAAIEQNDLDQLGKLLDKQQWFALVIRPLTNEVPQCAQYTGFTLLHYAAVHPATNLETMAFLVARCKTAMPQAIFKIDGKVMQPLDFLGAADKDYVINYKPTAKIAPNAPPSNCRKLLFSLMALSLVAAGFVKIFSQETPPPPNSRSQRNGYRRN